MKNYTTEPIPALIHGVPLPRDESLHYFGSVSVFALVIGAFALITAVLFYLAVFKKVWTYRLNPPPNAVSLLVPLLAYAFVPSFLATLIFVAEVWTGFAQPGESYNYLDMLESHNAFNHSLNPAINQFVPTLCPVLVAAGFWLRWMWVVIGFRFAMPLLFLSFFGTVLFNVLRLVYLWIN